MPIPKSLDTVYFNVLIILVLMIYAFLNSSSWWPSGILVILVYMFTWVLPSPNYCESGPIYGDPDILCCDRV